MSTLKTYETFVDERDSVVSLTGSEKLVLSQGGVTKDVTPDQLKTHAKTGLTAADVANVPAGNLAGINLQTALNELETEALHKATSETVTGAKTFNAGTFLDKGNQVFDVRAYGAVLDGVTDDAAALQATHDAMPSTGGKMYIPPGFTALLNSKLQISRSNFELDFTGATIKAGASAANLSLATGQPGLVHVRTTGATQTNVYIHGGTIDANNVAEVNNFSIFGAGSDDTLWTLTSVRVENVTFLNKGNSTATSSMVMIATGNVGSANPRVGRIRGVTFKNCTFRYGDKVMLLYTGDYMEDFTVDTCWFGDNVEHTIQQQNYTSNTIAEGNVRTSKRIRVINSKFINTMTSTAIGTRADFHDAAKTGGYDLTLSGNYHDAVSRTSSISTVGDRYAYNIHNWQRVDITHNHFYYMRAVVSIGGSIAASDWAYAGNQEVFFTDNHVHNAVTTFDLDATYNIKMHRNIFKDCAFGPFGAYGPHQNLEFHDNQLIDCNTFVEDIALLNGLGLTVAGLSEYQKSGIEIGGDNRMSFGGNKIIDTRSLQNPGASVATFSEVTGGALGARTYYVRISYENISGETLASTEQSTAVSVNKLLKIVPGSPAGLDTTFHTAQGIRKVNIYINSSASNETCQATLDYPGYLGQYSTGGWTEPTSGLFGQTITAVDTTNDLLTASGTPVPVTGMKVRLTTTGALPTGLATSTTYYVIYVSNTTFKLATSLLDAQYNLPIDITGAGSGTHSIVGAPLPSTNTTHALTKYGFFRLNGATNYAAGKNIYKDNEFFGIGTSYYFGTEYDIGTAPFVGNLMDDVALPQNISVGLESGADFVTYLQAPLQPTCTPSASGGTLATGTYYYVITALNAIGETVGSTEKSVSVTGPTGSVAVSWTAVTGATSYHVWRSTGTDQSHRQSGYFFSASSPFTDTGGALTPSTIPTVPTAIVNRLNSTGASYLTAGGLTVPTLTATSQVNYGVDPAISNGARGLYSSGLVFDSRVASSTNGIVFRTDTSSGQSERLKIAATGWIYIDSNLNGAALQSNNGLAFGWNKSAGDGESVLVYNTSAGALPRLALSSYTGSVYTEEATLKGGKLGIGQTAPTAVLHLKAGTTAANTAPLKLTSGSLMTTAEAGAIEFLTDKYYATITTGAARKEFVLSDDAVSLSTLALKAGTAAGNTAKVGGTVFDHFTDTSVGGAETDVYTDTLAASTLGTNGDKIFATYSGNFVTVGTEITQLKAYFGGTAIWDSTGVAPTTGTTSWRVFIEVIRVSATVVRYSVSLNTSGASGFVYETSGELTGLTLSNTNVIKVTGTSSGVGSGAGDIIGKMASVRWESAA